MNNNANMQCNGNEPGDSIQSPRVAPNAEQQQQQEEVVQVVYESDRSGSIVEAEASLVESYQAPASGEVDQTSSGPARVASILPSVAEESSTSTVAYNSTADSQNFPYIDADQPSNPNSADQVTPDPAPDAGGQPEVGPEAFHVACSCGDSADPSHEYPNTNPIDPQVIYSTINRQNRPPPSYEEQQQVGAYQTEYEQSASSTYAQQSEEDSRLYETFDGQSTLQSNKYSSADPPLREDDENQDPNSQPQDVQGEEDDINEEISRIISRNKIGAVESGSFRHNFRKKLAASASSNENDLTVHREKLLEQQTNKQASQEVGNQEAAIELDEPKDLPSKFKRTHSVSFNVNSSRTARMSVDLKNLPSYLTNKRASIVDIAKGAMSSLVHSFGSGAGSTTSSQRRDSSPDDDDEPIFEEPIAPTLSLGQRVAMVRDGGSEFGTVGWIGQLPQVEDDWMVGVIFDNMIGDCDGEYDGVRYFYARENYALFVPLSALVKTDNYIGRPETGTMLSRMSVSLKPGQLISIQRSSIRLQHCFLNAPHQRVGHDVRAVSNRLHCQCHNCGPCAHLTKQNRFPSHTHAFGMGHHAPNKKNSLAHAAVELLAHHHHHFHEEEGGEGRHEETQHEFGDNSAHACNFVRYSCCQQTGVGGHDFSADCQMVRPELLDNLIHAPRAPHRRSRPRRRKRAPKQTQNLSLQQQQQPTLTYQPPAAIEAPGDDETNPAMADQKLVEYPNEGGTLPPKPDTPATTNDPAGSYCSTCSSRSSSPADVQRNLGSAEAQSYYAENTVYNTMDSHISIMDQQRYIRQRNSSAFLYSQSSNYTDEYDDDNQSGYGYSGGLVYRIRRCLGCISSRKRDRRSKKPKKRKLSARNRMIEYRRKQSTFVPSTLAKPREDFASHGMLYPGSLPVGAPMNLDHRSDYSSYSSDGSGAKRARDGLSTVAYVENNPQSPDVYDYGTAQTNEQLENTQNWVNQTQNQNQAYNQPQAADFDAYARNGYSRDSALTDMDYFDSFKSSSNDTLKHIVDGSINEVVALPDPVIPGLDEVTSPIISEARSSPTEQVQVSSPTVSIMDQNDISNQMDQLDLNEDEENNQDH